MSEKAALGVNSLDGRYNYQCFSLLTEYWLNLANSYVFIVIFFVHQCSLIWFNSPVWLIKESFIDLLFFIPFISLSNQEVIIYHCLIIDIPNVNLCIICRNVKVLKASVMPRMHSSMILHMIRSITSASRCRVTDIAAQLPPKNNING